jgi:DNA-binding NarL/FixJ family response regulator
MSSKSKPSPTPTISARLDEIIAALRAGGIGFLLKDAPADEVVPELRKVAAGDALPLRE